MFFFQKQSKNIECLFLVQTLKIHSCENNYSYFSFNESREPIRLPEERSIAYHSGLSTNRSGFMENLPNTYEALASSRRRSALVSRGHEAAKFDQSEPDSSYGYRTSTSASTSLGSRDPPLPRSGNNRESGDVSGNRQSSLSRSTRRSDLNFRYISITLFLVK